MVIIRDHPQQRKRYFLASYKFIVNVQKDRTGAIMLLLFSIPLMRNTQKGLEEDFTVCPINNWYNIFSSLLWYNLFQIFHNFNLPKARCIVRVNLELNVTAV